MIRRRYLGINRNKSICISDRLFCIQSAGGFLTGVHPLDYDSHRRTDTDNSLRNVHASEKNSAVAEMYFRLSDYNRC